VIFVLYAAVALAGAGVHIWRHPEARERGAAIETVLLWWLVVTIGVAGIIGGLYHLLDGARVASEIGFTRGDGGFQTEVGFGDLALGIAAVLCVWFRDRYWLAIIVVAMISLWGDAYGHIHQAVVNDNHDPDNTGPVLYTDILFPLVALALYALRERVRPSDWPAAAPAATLDRSLVELPDGVPGEDRRRGSGRAGRDGGRPQPS
jgi:hypothetical protein